MLIQEYFDDLLVPWSWEALPGSVKIVDGYIEMSHDPGFGASLNHEEAAQYPFPMRRSTSCVYSRQDGSAGKGRS